MNENEDIKVTDTSYGDNKAFSRSRNHENTKSRNTEEAALMFFPKENANHDGKSDSSSPKKNCLKYVNNNTIDTDKSNIPSIITLCDPTELDISPPTSPSKGARRRKAFDTIKSYLEKNRSSQKLDKGKYKDSSDEQVHNQTETNTDITSNPLSVFGESMSSNNIENETGAKFYTASIDTANTNIENGKPRTLYDVFKNAEQLELRTDEYMLASKESESEFGTDIITIGKNKEDVIVPVKSKIKTLKLKSSPIEKLAALQSSGLLLKNQTKMVSLFVGDLSQAVTENDLYLYFSKYKGLISVKIPMDTVKNASLGYGYVNFDLQENADIATDGLNYTFLKGNEIRIMPSVRDKQQRENLGANLFFSNLSSKLSSRIMYDRFKAFAHILSCKYSAEKRTCFINFSEKLGAYKICKQFNQTQMDGQTISVSVHISKKDRDLFQQNNKLPKSQTFTKSSVNAGIICPSSEKVHNTAETKQLPSDSGKEEKKESTKFSIFLRNLPLSLKEDVIRNLVEPYGTVRNIIKRDVPLKNGSWALITLTNKTAVDRTIQNLNSLEIEGKKLFVTRAIPREEKDYAKREEQYPKRKLKLLISGIDLENNKEALEQWCNECESIKSAEFFSTSPKGETPLSNKYNGYGYIELNNVDDADTLINQFKELGISCYKIKIEVPSKEINSDNHRYPYVVNTNGGFPSHGNVTFSYVDPGKMFQIANFQQTVTSDKLNSFQKLENYNKLKLKERNRVDKLDDDAQRVKMDEMYHVLWEISVRQLFPINTSWRTKCSNLPVGGVLTKAKASSLIDHLVKFFWNNNFREFYKFIKQSQFDDKGNIIYAASPVLETQIKQSAQYLGIIPK